MNERCQKSKRAYWRKFGGARRPLAAGRFARTGEGRMKGGEPVFGVRCSVFGTRMIGRAQAMATGRREPPFAHGVEAYGHLRTPAGVAPSERPVANRSPRTPGDERPVSGRASRGRRVAHRAARAGPIVATHAAPRPFVGRPAGSGRARPDRPLAPPARRPELSRTADTGRDAAPCPDS
ncbi:hypothetical protein ACGYWN_23990 [Burkholderia pseudomallei]|uniref:hypothetical protein n=2 Tax=Burkholderia pseudomallei TaxID=28450 RepID=UPI0013921FD8|nr:hypothetical protein [Burkholderia pseudomallei]MCE2053687.1 hypothetical protein [Burkholderia pseudomallei OB]MBF3414011.1 hypothetical protein [Burkholderia pseudomallei]MBF3438354.1 hypothetical protein [Burkholderia pseudomallei]MBF3456304.1 hypothetical protein [Burkholderia pseudomallei]MBF3468304.1 hypothetical protein [Burkholderia pseudomallei]